MCLYTIRNVLYIASAPFCCIKFYAEMAEKYREKLEFLCSLLAVNMDMLGFSLHFVSNMDLFHLLLNQADGL